MLAAAVVRCEPGPKYREEVYAPGRQGIRAKRETNPARGSAHLLWDHAPRHTLPSAAPCRSVTFLGDVSRHGSVGS
jgi:hypothetical protein